MTLKRSLVIVALGLLLVYDHALAVSEGDTTTVTVSGTLVDAPECTINSNNNVLVDFGDNVITRNIDGVKYEEPMTVTLSCKSRVKDNMTLTIRATKDAGFGSGLVGTDTKGLGIQLKAAGKNIRTGDRISFIYPTVPKLSAVLVAQDNTSLRSGKFEGTGTLVINYQ